MARNKFNRPCYVCGLIVVAGTGHFERHNGGWRTKHAVAPGDGRVTCEMAARQRALILIEERKALAEGEVRPALPKQDSQP